MFRKAFILVFLIAFCNCNRSNREVSKIENKEVELVNDKTLYSASEFDSLIKNNPSAVLIDVRTSNEFSKGHLKDALNLDWKSSEFQKQLEAVDKDQTILVYCLSGGRSSEAAEEMRKKGYANVLELDGGILAWRAENLPEVGIEKGKKGMTLESYNKLIDSDKLVLVDFNAVWCAPCKKMKPFIEKIEQNYKDRILVLKIDVDENSDLAKELNIAGLPVLKLYKSGKIVWEHVGFASEEEITTQLNKS